MLKQWSSTIYQGAKAPVALIILLLASILCIGLINRWVTEVQPLDGPTQNYHLDGYAERVSSYSLVRINALELGRIPEENKTLPSLVTNHNSKLFQCIGQVRHADDKFFVDVTALTLSIIALENYNRTFFRRRMELYWQNIMQVLGLPADYTIGIAQIRTSIARRVYGTKIDVAANESAITSFSTSDCGSVYLASLLIDEYLEDCKSSKISITDVDTVIGCVVQKYTGLNENSRLYQIYKKAAIKSYVRLVDPENEFYYRAIKSQMSIEDVKAGECVEFNPRRSQIRIEPKQEAKEVGHAKPEKLIADPATTLEFSRSQAASQNDIVKIMPAVVMSEIADSAQAMPSIVRRQREDFLFVYACKKYGLKSVDIYPAIRVIPQKIRELCGNADAQFEPGTYILMIVSGKSGAGAMSSHQCREFGLLPPVTIPPPDSAHDLKTKP
jgi:hypothetical protein